MGPLFKEIFNKLPGWFYGVTAVVVLIFVIIILGYFVWAAKKFADGVNKESKIQTLQEEKETLKEKNLLLKGTSSQLDTAMNNVRAFTITLGEIRELDNSAPLSEEEARDRSANIAFQLNNLLARVVDSLAADMKFEPGDLVRCGYWLNDTEIRKVQLIVGSSGFPQHYINARQLGIDNSIAGKALRLNKTINVPDVTLSEEWSRNPGSNSKYNSIVAIPIKSYGVLTIDSIVPVIDESLTIAEMYGALLELISLETILNFQRSIVNPPIDSNEHEPV